MNYYEELGLTAAASPDEIRKAHRTFSRLLHPDQQTDESLRQAAELQMRRLNSVVDLLLDPQQRRKYDDGLRAPSRVVLPRAPARPPKRPRLSFLQLIAIVAAAATITLGAIWVFAGDFIPLRAQSSEITVAVRTLPASSRANFVSQTKKEDPPSPSSLLEPLPRHERPEQDHPQAALKQPVESAIAMGTDPLPLTPLADAPPRLPLPAPVPNTMVSAEIPPVSPAAAFAGLWLLPTPEKTRASTGHAPQFIQIRLHRGPNDTIYGQYFARYRVPDRPISPEVAFTFEGPVRGDSAAFDWDAPDGSRGVVELKLLNPHAMQVSWHVATFGWRIGIAGSAAVVIRTETP